MVNMYSVIENSWLLKVKEVFVIGQIHAMPWIEMICNCLQCVAPCCVERERRSCRWARSTITRSSRRLARWLSTTPATACCHPDEVQDPVRGLVPTGFKEGINYQPTTVLPDASDDLDKVQRFVCTPWPLLRPEHAISYLCLWP